MAKEKYSIGAEGRAAEEVGTPRSVELRLYRLHDVLARIPVSRSSWFAGIKSGRFPRGHHLGPRTTVWRSDEIDALIHAVIASSVAAPWSADDIRGVVQ